jgi:hypothetical protein
MPGTIPPLFAPSAGSLRSVSIVPSPGAFQTAGGKVGLHVAYPAMGGTDQALLLVMMTDLATLTGMTIDTAAAMTTTEAALQDTMTELIGNTQTRYKSGKRLLRLKCLSLILSGLLDVVVVFLFGSLLLP